MSQVLNMRYPKELLKRIDEFKEKKGFTTRTQTIIYLIQYALEQLDNKNLHKKSPPKRAYKGFTATSRGKPCSDAIYRSGRSLPPSALPS